MTKITRDQLPDHNGEPIKLYSDTGHYLGQLIFDKGTSRLEQPAEQLPYRPMPSKAKHRR